MIILALAIAMSEDASAHIHSGLIDTTDGSLVDLKSVSLANPCAGLSMKGPLIELDLGDHPQAAIKRECGCIVIFTGTKIEIVPCSNNMPAVSINHSHDDSPTKT